MFKQLRARCRPLLKIQMGLWSLVFSLQLFVPAHGTVHTLHSSDLPFTVSTAYNNDTIRIAGTRISATGTAISISPGVHDVLFDFGTDTLEFGTGGGYNASGMYIIGSAGDNVRDLEIRGGHILRDVDTGVSVGNYNRCVRLGRAHDVQFIGTNLTIDGHDAKCVLIMDCYSIYFEKGTWTSNSTSFTSRHMFDGAVLYSASNSSPEDYTFKMYGVTIANGPAQGVIVMDSKAIIDSCTLTTDHVNDYGSNANQYLIFCRSAFAGTQITRNQFISGSNRGGSRGVVFDNCLGTEADPIVIRDNVFDLHSGPDPENPGGILRGIRIRAFPGSATGHINVINNTMVATVDNDPATTWIGTTASSVNLGVSSYDSGYVRIDSNVVYARSLSGSGTDIKALEMASNTSAIGKNIVIAYNQFYSCNTVVQLCDQANGVGCQDAYFARNTLGLMDTTAATGDPTAVISNPKTWLVGYNSRVSTGNISIDGYYKNGASDQDISWYGSPISGSRDLCQRRTVRVYVQGENLQPVEGAQVLIVNALGATVASGNTNQNGRFMAGVTYWFESNVAEDSTNLNPFRITTWYESDSAVDSNFTIGYLSSQGRDTLTLSLTTGTGTWLDDSDDDTPIDDPPDGADITPPDAIMDLSAECGGSYGTAFLTWTATGDDGNVGQATRYELGYSESPITNDNFNDPSVVKITDIPAPKPSGQPESLVVTFPDISILYYLAIVAYDDVDLRSPVDSNATIPIWAIRSPPLIDTPLVNDLDHAVTLRAYPMKTCLDVYYEFQLDTLTDFSTGRTETDSAFGDMAQVIYQDILTNTVYYWRCRAVAADGSEQGPYSYRVGFLPFFEGSTGCEDLHVISPEQGGTVTSRQPDLTVRSPATSGNIIFFELSDRSDFAHPVAAGAVSQQEETTSWSVSEVLDIGKLYYWRARMNNCPFSPAQTFTVVLSAAGSDEEPCHAYPNPFRPGSGNDLTFRGIPAHSNLTIMTVSGQVVRHWIDVGGEVTVQWNGLNAAGSPVASGVYMWYIEGTDLKGKLIVIR